MATTWIKILTRCTDVMWNVIIFSSLMFGRSNG
jgi:hypothetical protein